jgi:3-oxoacyl-[acyl-carrier protein] reductase
MRILITGASRGLGLYLASHFAEQGHTVVGCARSASEFTHERYRHMQFDATDETALTAAMVEIRQRYGGLDALINNAGTAGMVPIALTPVGKARDILNVNFLSTFVCTRAAVRLLRASDNARIVNMSSVAVPLRLDGEAVYAAAKSAIETFTRISAKEFGRWGITCNAVGPSPVRTNLLRGVPEDKLDALIQRQSIPEWATPADVANAVDFFLRPESRMVTGQVLYLGGIA